MSRGYVQHVTTQQQRYFVDIDGLTDFIRNHLTPPGQGLETVTPTPEEQKSAENLRDIIQDE